MPCIGDGSVAGQPSLRLVMGKLSEGHWWTAAWWWSGFGGQLGDLGQVP